MKIVAMIASESESRKQSRASARTQRCLSVVGVG
jgi:hypothetical protein